MRIGIDARCLEEEKISGVGEYTLEIIRNLLEIDQKNQYFVFSNSFRQKSNHFSFLENYPKAKLKRFRWPNKLFNFSLWYFGWPKLDKLIGLPASRLEREALPAGGADIIFAPNIIFLAVSHKCRLITTFHDLTFERFPEFFTQKTRLWHYYFVNPRRIAQKSARLIAVSQSSKKDLGELYALGPEKISVVYHGTGDDFRMIDRNDPKLLEVQKKYNLPYKFILYLGNVEPRKNIRAIIEAYKKFRAGSPKFEKYKLVLAGSVSPLCYDIIEKERNNIRIIGYIERQYRPHVMNLASLFVYPSHFEGFGLPLLEAMACGTPVITSNNSSIPEVVGSAAVMTNPSRPQELTEAMREILGNEKLYGNLREKGLKQAQKFSWKKSAKETLTVIASEAKQSRI